MDGLRGRKNALPARWFAGRLLWMRRRFLFMAQVIGKLINFSQQGKGNMGIVTKRWGK